MIKNLVFSIKSFGLAFSLFKDKWVLALSALPVFIGCLLYYFLGRYIFSSLLPKGKEIIEGYLSGVGEFAYYFLVALATVALLFFINYTFVLIVSLIASPVNDFLSTRVLHLLKGKGEQKMEEGFRRLIKRYTSILLAEIKKILFILAFSLLSFFFSFLPLGQFVTLFISSFLLAIQFVDYSWCREELSFRNCLKDYQKKFLPYTLCGGLLLVLMGIPVLNIIILPFAVVLYTVLYVNEAHPKH